MSPLYLCGDVDETMVGRVLTAVEEGVDRLVLNSDGGGVYSALAIFDLILGKNITIIATGACMSAAVLVLLAGKHRYATPHCRFLLHPISIGGSEPSKADAAEVSFLGTELAEIIHSRGCISLPKARELLAEETYFGANYARSIGLIHEIQPITERT